MAQNEAVTKAAQPEPPQLMNKSVKTGLILNASGVGLFLLWLFIQNRLPLAFSLALAVLFCGLLGLSLFYLFRAARHVPNDTPRSNPSQKSPYRKE